MDIVIFFGSFLCFQHSQLRCSDWVYFVNNRSCGTFVHPQSNFGYVTSIRPIEVHYSSKIKFSPVSFWPWVNSTLCHFGLILEVFMVSWVRCGT